VNLFLLLVAIRLLSSTFSLSWTDAALIVLLSGHAIINNIRLGQAYILLAVLMITGWQWCVRGRPVLSGIALGVMAPIKYYPVSVIAALATGRKWTSVVTACIMTLLVVIVGALSLGWDLNFQYFTTVVGTHATLQLSTQDPFSASFQSWDSLLRRLFVYDEKWNASPLFRADFMYPTLKIAIMLSTLLMTILSLRIAARHSLGHLMSSSVVLLVLLSLLLAPGTATYHLAILWLPLGVLVNGLFRQDQSRSLGVVILGLYMAVGFFPYQLTRPFDGKGVLSMLAYPRLFLLTALFGCALASLRNMNWPLSVYMGIPNKPVAPPGPTGETTHKSS
jgi:hypothetical protein